MSDKRLRCRIGVHRRYLDCALVHSAYRCSECHRYENHQAAQKLRDERNRLSYLPKGASLAEMYRAGLGWSLTFDEDGFNREDPASPITYPWMS